MAEPKGISMANSRSVPKQESGRIFFGLIVIVVGVLFLLGNLIPGFSVGKFIGQFWPVILILVGFYLILGHRRLRRVEANFSAASHNRFIGDMKLDLAGREIGEVNSSIFIGDLSLDLSKASLKSGENYVNASLFIGDGIILVPANFIIKIQAKALVGDLKFERTRDDGVFPRIEYEDEGYSTAERRLLVNANGLIGDLTIQRIGN